MRLALWIIQAPKKFFRPQDNCVFIYEVASMWPIVLVSYHIDDRFTNRRLKVKRNKFCGRRKWCYLSMLLKHLSKEGVIIVASLKFKEVPNPHAWHLEEQLYLVLDSKTREHMGYFYFLFISSVNPKHWLCYNLFFSPWWCIFCWNCKVVYPMCTTHPPPKIFIPPRMDGDVDDALKKIEMSHSLVDPQLYICSIIIE